MVTMMARAPQSLFALFAAAVATIGATRAEGVPEPLAGAVMAHGGGTLHRETIRAFVERGGGAEGRLVVIPTASADTDAARLRSGWRARGFGAVAVLDAADRGAALAESFSEPLHRATAVWIGGGQQSRLEAIYGGTPVVAALRDEVERGGVVGGTSAGAAILSRTMIRSGPPAGPPVIGTGFGLLPGVVVDQHFSERGRAPRLWEALGDHPGLLGYGIDEGAALLIDGRRMSVTGSGAAHVLLTADRSGQRDATRFALVPGVPGDHIALRRAAIERADAEPFPPAEPAASAVEAGTVVLIGGGAPPKRGLRAFIDASGGGGARIVIIPTAADDRPKHPERELTIFGELGAENLKALHARDRAEAGSAEFIAELDRAGGVWFTGGRQWRLVDRYLGTPAEDAFRRVLERGGAVGGTSAGATICGEYLVRGDPLGNRRMMAEGYERGLALVPGLAVDQHFSQRNRLRDLVALKRQFPGLLAIGIDESTTAIIEGSTLRVSGIGEVTVMHRALAGISHPQRDEHYEVLGLGDRFDLAKREVRFRWPGR